jgi:hypothetical protein
MGLRSVERHSYHYATDRSAASCLCIRECSWVKEPMNR